MRLSAASQKGDEGVGGSQRDNVMGPDPGMPFGVMAQIVRRIQRLMDKFGRGRRILIHKVDVESLFRQVEADSAGAVNFRYDLDDYLFFDLLLRVGWKEPRVGGGYSPEPFNKLSDRRPGH